MNTIQEILRLKEDLSSILTALVHEKKIPMKHKFCHGNGRTAICIRRIDPSIIYQKIHFIRAQIFSPSGLVRPAIIQAKIRFLITDVTRVKLHGFCDTSGK
uniref:Uncharacterized protein n=1 Tax=Vespula pensylvanica TaxID=30213 RepID=A0A834KMI1_VESPE|nr:hypothetical protein H0235_014242 [Vespula pensylvanica]